MSGTMDSFAEVLREDEICWQQLESCFVSFVLLARTAKATTQLEHWSEVNYVIAKIGIK